MKVYIQTNQKNMPYSVNGYVAMKAFEQMEFEIILFKSLDEVLPNMNRENIVVGGIQTVRRRLNQLKIKLTILNQLENT